MTKIGFISLGCPKNQVDCEVMLKKVADAGYELVAEDIDADIIIVNTCAFIESAKQEAIDNILDVAWLKENRNLQGIIVTGCLAQRYRDEIFTELPEVDAVVGCGGIHDIVEAVKAVEKKIKYSSYPDMADLDLGGERVVTTPAHYAYLKIAEGCDNRCTYCAIPDIRGAFRSRDMQDIIAEAKELEALGAKELILVAQDTTRYGMDINGDVTLSTLIRGITDNTERVRIRLLYCYPDKISDELVREIAENDRVIKYVDMPIQHISDKVLKRMNRRGGSAVIKDAVKRLREGVPGIVIRTTVIVGFPGETQEDFLELCEYMAEARFDRLGCFPYSREEDTPAYDFEDQIDEDVKAQRAETVMHNQSNIALELCEEKIGQVLRVVCEGYDPVGECYFGRSDADAPEIDGKVYFLGPKGMINEGDEVDIRINDVIDYDLIGEKI